MSSDKNQRKFYPSKKLGQNFLHDQNILIKICALGNINKDKDTVIEIGPGLGSLTKHIAEKAKLVYAIEKDKRLLDQLKENIKNYSNIELINEDALNIDYSLFTDCNNLKLISNLPYNISTPILLKIHKERHLFSNIVVMIQKEVGERICSEKNCKNYGSLSILFQNYFDTKVNFKVSPESFNPKPKVDSVVISLRPLKNSRFKVKDEKFFQSFIRSAFSARRKMLRNSLSNLFEKTTIDTALKNKGIDYKRRAETLSVEEFVKLSNEFYELLR